MRKNALFIGMYPNDVNTYKNIFFQNLIYAIADEGVNCTVISPVSITKYLWKISNIPHKTTHRSPKGAVIDVYYPRFISASSVKIGKFNTEIISESLFERRAVKFLTKVEKKFDFVYGHFILYGGLAAIQAGRMLNIPSFFAFGECDFNSQVMNTYGIPRNSRIEGLAGIISVSTKNTNELKKLDVFKNVPILTSPNAIDLSLFYPMEKDNCRELLGIPKDKFVVGFVGGFIDRKGDKRLLEAVNQIEDIYVAYAGKGKNPPTGSRVVFCKAIAHERVAVFLNAIDVFVLPTLNEGSCNAIVEAMACNSAIISSNLSFNYDALNNSNSILVDPNSIEEIRDAIIKIRDHTELRTKLANRALEDSKEFNISFRAKVILNFIYDRCNEVNV